MKALAIPMSEAFSDVRDEEDFGYRLRDFLDRFRERPDASLLEDEPALLEPALDDGRHADAFLAATAAWLANKHRLRVPDWAKGSSRALEKPRFAARTHNLRMVLLEESPTEFRLRNLFVSANALHRA